MDSGLGSDEDRRCSRTKEQKQRHNQQLLTSKSHNNHSNNHETVNSSGNSSSCCFIDASSLQDEQIDLAIETHEIERRKGALLFKNNIPQYSMMQITQREHSETPETPYNSIVHLENVREIESSVQPAFNLATEDEIQSNEAQGCNNKQSLGFFVDLNEVFELQQPQEAPSCSKNMFSMEINFEAPKKEKPTRLSSGKERFKSSERNSDCAENSLDREKLELPSVKSEVILDKIASNSQETAEIPIKKDVKFVRLSDLVETSDPISFSLTQPSPKPLSLTANLPRMTRSIPDQSWPLLESHLSIAPTKSRITGYDTVTVTSKKPAASITSLFNSSSVLLQTGSSSSSGYRTVPASSRGATAATAVVAVLPSDDEDEFSNSNASSVANAIAELPNSSSANSSGSNSVITRRRLGTDLLRMFLEEIDTDVVLEVAGKKVRAHRCILISRCQYFAGTLRPRGASSNYSTTTPPTTTTTLSILDGFSYAAVHFALCHIYSGAAHVPDTLSLVELASLADLLALEGLKEVVSDALRTRHCHHFHSPCAGGECVTGVLEVLALSAAYNLDELHQRCVTWTTRHYTRVWPTRAFTVTLPRDLRTKCYQQHLVYMTARNVLVTWLTTEQLQATMTSSNSGRQQQSQQVSGKVLDELIGQLLTACHSYLRHHYAAVLPHISTAVESSGQLARVERLLLATLDEAGGLSVEQCCRAYIKCHLLMDEATELDRHHRPSSSTSSITTTVHYDSVAMATATIATSTLLLLHKIEVRLEGCLVSQWCADKLSKCVTWTRHMSPQLKARVMLCQQQQQQQQVAGGDDAVVTCQTVVTSSTTSRLPRRRRRHGDGATPPLLLSSLNCCSSSDESSRRSSGGSSSYGGGGAAVVSNSSSSLRRSLLLAAKLPQQQQQYQQEKEKEKELVTSSRGNYVTVGKTNPTNLQLLGATTTSSSLQSNSNLQLQQRSNSHSNHRNNNNNNSSDRRQGNRSNSSTLTAPTKSSAAKCANSSNSKMAATSSSKGNNTGSSNSKGGVVNSNSSSMNGSVVMSRSNVGISSSIKAGGNGNTVTTVGITRRRTVESPVMQRSRGSMQQEQLLLGRGRHATLESPTLSKKGAAVMVPRYLQPRRDFSKLAAESSSARKQLPEQLVKKSSQKTTQSPKKSVAKVDSPKLSQQNGQKSLKTVKKSLKMSEIPIKTKTGEVTKQKSTANYHSPLKYDRKEISSHLIDSRHQNLSDFDRGCQNSSKFDQNLSRFDEKPQNLSKFDGNCQKLSSYQNQTLLSFDTSKQQPVSLNSIMTANDEPETPPPSLMHRSGTFLMEDSVLLSSSLLHIE